MLRLKLSVIAILMFSLNSTLLSQSNSNYLDSLSVIFESNKQSNHSVAFEALYKIAKYKLITQDPTGKAYINKYLDFSRHKGNLVAEMKGNLLSIQHLIQVGDYTVAEAKAKKVIRFYTDTKDTTLLTEAIIRYGNAMEYQGKIDTAHIQYFKALSLIESSCNPKEDDLCGIAACMANMHVAVLYWDQGYVEKTSKYVDDARAHIERLYTAYPNDPNVIFEYATLLSNMATLADGPESFSLKIDFFEKALSLIKKIGVLDSEILILYNIAATYFHNNELGKAKEYALQSIALSQQGKDITMPLPSQILLAQILIDQNSHNEASDWLDKTEPIAWSANRSTFITAILRLRVKIDSLNENYSQALISLNRFYEVKDSLFNQSNHSLISSLEENYQIEKAEREKAQINTALARSKSQQTFRVSAILLLLIILLSGTIISILNNHKILRQKELAQQSVRLAQLEQDKLNGDLEKKELELAYKNKELATMASRLIERNAFTNQLRTYLDQNPTSNQSLLHDLKKQLSYQEQATVDLQEFRLYIDEVNQDFFFKLESSAPELTDKDKRLCALFRMEMNVKEIASINNVSENAIRTAKHRIRKKLNLADEIELEQFLKSI